MKINFGKKKTNKTTQEKNTTKIFFFKADTSSASEFLLFSIQTRGFVGFVVLIEEC